MVLVRNVKIFLKLIFSICRANKGGVEKSDGGGHRFVKNQKDSKIKANSTNDKTRSQIVRFYSKWFYSFQFVLRNAKLIFQMMD